jgi:hypothetical protein
MCHVVLQDCVYQCLRYRFVDESAVGYICVHNGATDIEIGAFQPPRCTGWELQRS